MIFIILKVPITAASDESNCNLSYDIASEIEITPCIKIDKPLVVYRFSVNLMTSHIWQNPNVFMPKYDFKIILMSYDK